MPVSRAISRMLLPCRCNTRISKAASTPNIQSLQIEGDQPSQWVSFQSATWVRITAALTRRLSRHRTRQAPRRRQTEPHRAAEEGHGRQAQAGGMAKPLQVEEANRRTGVRTDQTGKGVQT